MWITYIYKKIHIYKKYNVYNLWISSKNKYRIIW